MAASLPEGSSAAYAPKTSSKRVMTWFPKRASPRRNDGATTAVATAAATDRNATAYTSGRRRPKADRPCKITRVVHPVAKNTITPPGSAQAEKPSPALATSRNETSRHASMSSGRDAAFRERAPVDAARTTTGRSGAIEARERQGAASGRGKAGSRRVISPRSSPDPRSSRSARPQGHRTPQIPQPPVPRIQRTPRSNR